MFAVQRKTSQSRTNPLAQATDVRQHLRCHRDQLSGQISCEHLGGLAIMGKFIGVRG